MQTSENLFGQYENYVQSVEHPEILNVPQYPPNQYSTGYYVIPDQYLSSQYPPMQYPPMQYSSMPYPDNNTIEAENAQDNGLECALLLNMCFLLFGFCFPLCWFFGFYFLLSENETVKFLAKINTFLAFATIFIFIIIAIISIMFLFDYLLTISYVYY